MQMAALPVVARAAFAVLAARLLIQGRSMTDVAPDANPAGSTAPQIRILAQYTRDFSFENPRAPDSLRATDAQPGMEMSVEMAARGRPDGFFEVDLKISCHAKQGEQTAFQVELLYGGLFEILNVSEDQIEPILLVECPRFLFPFARRIIADATADGGFPPFQMEPMDFAGVYQAQLAARESGQVLQ
jgi:preprotein translocase subunit SecB